VVQGWWVVPWVAAVVGTYTMVMIIVMIMMMMMIPRKRMSDLLFLHL